MSLLAVQIMSRGPVARVVAQFSDWLATVSSRPWFYGLIFVIALLDAFFPIVPSETAVILGGIAAGRGQLFVGLVLLVAAAGAFCGDNVSYQIGAGATHKINAWLERSPKRKARLDWAHAQLAKRGPMLLLTARFIPGGRSIITIASGLTHQPRRRFRIFTAIAALCWAAYATGLGFFFGNQFKDNHSKAFILAFACAIGLSVAIEAVRWLRGRGQHD